MFDLPVETDEERKAANDFRNHLKDLGFAMAQYSVYMRHASGRAECDAYTERIRALLPNGGKVYVHCMTDKQYEQIVRFERRQRRERPKNPEQFLLF